MAAWDRKGSLQASTPWVCGVVGHIRYMLLVLPTDWIMKYFKQKNHNQMGSMVIGMALLHRPKIHLVQYPTSNRSFDSSTGFRCSSNSRLAPN